VVAYQCLTGTVPYDGEDSFSIGYKHITEPVPVPQLITADERRLFEVIKRMLMKDPADRFQSCEELVASIQGQPIAAAGSVRASVATVAAGVSTGTASPVVGGAPLIVSQPTTPLESPLVNRRMTPRERREIPRRVADRSLAMRSSGSSWAWIWVVLAVLGGIGGGLYYYKSRGFATGVGVGVDSAAVDTGGGAPDPSAGSGVDSARPGAPADSGRRVATPPAEPAPRASAPSGSATPTPTPPVPPRAPADSARPRGGDSAPATTADSGAVHLVGLPRGSTVMIDERPVLEPVTRLIPGPHTLAISAPRFNFFTDTITIAAGDTLELTPELQPLGAPLIRRREARSAGRCDPGPGYNRDGSCFDERPKPVNPPFVPVPEGVEGEPRPSLLWVKVSTEGRTVDVQRLRSSDNADFERAVRDFVWTVTWHPALKDGAPVEAWTQMLFPPLKP